MWLTYWGRERLIGRLNVRVNVLQSCLKITYVHIGIMSIFHRFHFDGFTKILFFCLLLSRNWAKANNLLKSHTELRIMLCRNFPLPFYQITIKIVTETERKRQQLQSFLRLTRTFHNPLEAVLTGRLIFLSPSVRNISHTCPDRSLKANIVNAYVCKHRNRHRHWWRKHPYYIGCILQLQCVIAISDGVLYHLFIVRVEDSHHL